MTLALFIIGAIMAAAFVAWLYWQDFKDFVAPDIAAEDALRQRLGDAPEFQAAMARFNGPGRPWREAAIGLSGLAGILITTYILFR